MRFLANRDEHLHFGLLTDFADAPAETLPEDEALLLLARSGIEELNEKYAGAGRADTVSSCSIARAAGTRGSGGGWATSASAASSPT